MHAFKNYPCLTADGLFLLDKFFRTSNLKWFGVWHEFAVVKTDRGYWSFEKGSEGIRVQRGGSEESVKGNYRGKRRTGTVEPEGRPNEQVNGGDTIRDIFHWIYDGNQLYWGYHATKRNCHVFAFMLFEAIARQKDRRLKQS